MYLGLFLRTYFKYFLSKTGNGHSGEDKLNADIFDIQNNILTNTARFSGYKIYSLIRKNQEDKLIIGPLSKRTCIY
jgi:hypothetical protein